jgi:hypothetical protein
MKTKRRRPYRPRPRSKWRGVKPNLTYLHAYEEAIIMADMRAIQGINPRPLYIGFRDLQRHVPGRYSRVGTNRALKRRKAQGILRCTTASRFAGQTYCIREVEAAYLARLEKGAA